MTQYLTKAEVAERLRVHEHTVARYIRRGLLEAVKTTDTPHGHVRIPTDSYEAFLAKRAVKPGAGKGWICPICGHLNSPDLVVCEKTAEHD